MAGQPVSVRASQEKRAAALLALLQANTARAHALAAERMTRTRGNACCPACEKAALELEALRLAAEIQKVEIDYLKNMGFFDWMRSSGRASAMLEMARNQGHPTSETADSSGKCAVV